MTYVIEVWFKRTGIWLDKFHTRQLMKRHPDEKLYPIDEDGFSRMDMYTFKRKATWEQRVKDMQRKFSKNEDIAIEPYTVDEVKDYSKIDEWELPF